MAKASGSPEPKITVGKEESGTKWLAKSDPLTIKDVIYLVLNILASLG